MAADHRFLAGAALLLIVASTGVMFTNSDASVTARLHFAAPAVGEMRRA